MFQFENESTIADKLVDVPMMKPVNPKRPIRIFFAIIAALAIPDFSFKNTHVSKIAGKKSASEVIQNTPNNEINKSSFGIATAMRTRNNKKKTIIKNILSQAKYKSMVDILTSD